MQQEAHLPPERCPLDEERCQPTAQNSSRVGGREGNVWSWARGHPGLNPSALDMWFYKGLTPHFPAGTKGHDKRPRTKDAVTQSGHSVTSQTSVNREVTWHPSLVSCSDFLSATQAQNISCNIS